MKRIQLLYVREAKGDPVRSPADIALLMAEEAKADREAFWVLHLNTKNKILEKELVSLGILDHAMVHPREVFKKAILNSSSNIITVHNHPGDDPEPSNEDIAVWDKLIKAGEIIGITVLDNLVITPGGRFYSQKDRAG